MMIRGITLSRLFQRLTGFFILGKIVNNIVKMTRLQLQFMAIVEVDAILETGVTCVNTTRPKSGLFEDFHDGLARIVALIIALQIDFRIQTCTGNTFAVDDVNITFPDDADDYPLTYMFSTCAQDFLIETIQDLNDENNNCLLTGNITDEQFNERVNQSLLAGEVIPLDHQCQLTYGVDSESCVNESTNSTVDTTGLCGPGVFCRVNGECSSRTIVYSGTTCGTEKLCFKGECIEFDCGAPPMVEGGYYFLTDGSTRLFGRATLICSDRYRVNGEVTITCRSNGWSDPADACALIDCGEPPKTQNGTFVNKGNNTVGAVASLKCNANYSVNSSHTCISCGLDGNWTEPQAECILDCGPVLPPTPNGFYKVITPFVTVGAVAVLCCFDGYNTSRRVEVICEDPLIFPNDTCQPIACDLPDVDNGMYVPKPNTNFGNIAILRCNESFAPSTDMTSIVCQSNGSYSPQMAECVPDCGTPPDTDNGFYRLDNDSTLLGSTAKLFCCNGTFVRRDSRITCTANGWMGVESCSADPCPNSDWVQEKFSCYLFDTNMFFFSQSRAFCLLTEGSTLVEINNLAENEFLDFYATNISRPEPDTGYWIGAVQDGLNGTLRWQSGEEVDFFAWGPNQPDDRNFNNTITQQSCTMLWRLFDYHWADIECDVGVPGEPDMRMGFSLCEYPLDPHIV